MGDNVFKCIYDDEKRSRSTSAHLSNRADGRLSRQILGGVLPVKTSAVKSTHSPTRSTPDAAWPTTDESSALQVFKADQVPEGRPSGALPICRNSSGEYIPLDPNPAISISSFFLPQTIPPDPWIPLSFLGEEKLQVQSAELNSTDLDFRA